MRKVYLRILPFAVLTYFFCYLDRINVGFASLTMNKDLGLDAAWYGMAAGAFFWGYVLFEVPSNIILEKVGARIWIARIMVTWGIVSGCTAFATGPYSFMAIRFLLGLAEAGLFPGFVLYFTYWFPDQHRARINSGLPWRCRSLWRAARRSRPPCWGSTACSASGDGRRCISSRPSRPC
jgi:ACS family tartrate transporter-like MFS transporter